jgi:hypothetical protein
MEVPAPPLIGTMGVSDKFANQEYRNMLLPGPEFADPEFFYSTRMMDNSTRLLPSEVQASQVRGTIGIKTARCALEL